MYTWAITKKKSMAKTSSSILPDALINVGTGFGVLLGLTIGLTFGLMAEPTAPAPLPTGSSIATQSETTDATIRAILVERASLVASVLRSQATSGSADAPRALLQQNSTALAAGLRTIGNPALAARVVTALDRQMVTTENYLTLSLAENVTEATNAKNILLETTDALNTAITAITGTTTQTARPVTQAITQALVDLVPVAGKTQGFSAEAKLASAFNRLATFLRNNRS